MQNYLNVINLNRERLVIFSITSFKWESKQDQVKIATKFLSYLSNVYLILNTIVFLNTHLTAFQNGGCSFLMWHPFLYIQEKLVVTFTLRGNLTTSSACIDYKFNQIIFCNNKLLRLYFLCVQCYNCSNSKFKLNFTFFFTYFTNSLYVLFICGFIQ